MHKWDLLTVCFKVRILGMCFGMNEVCKVVESGRRVASAIRFLVKARDLQLECARVLYETLLAPVLCRAVRQTMEGKGEI